MMDIAIPYDLELDVKKTSILSNKSTMSCKTNDNIIFNIELLEDGVKKEISDDCSISLISAIALKDGTTETYIQNNKDHGGIEVVTDESSTKIIIKVMDFFTLNESDKVLSELVIADSDESISTQKFKFNVIGTLNGTMAKDAFNSINTLEELDVLIEAEKQALIDLRTEVNNVETDIDNKIIEINNKIDKEDTKVDELITDINDKIKNVNNVINTQLLKTIPLSIYNVTSSTVVYFITDLFTMESNQLLDKTFALSVGGYVESDYYNTSIGHIVFTLENGSIKSNYQTALDKSLNGSQVGVSVLFSNMSNTIGKSVSDFKLIIKTNLKKSLLTEGYSAFARLTPLANGYIY